MSVRAPAVAGLFYSADRGRLEAEVKGLMDAAAPATLVSKAVIAPHAGYVYSGPVAASAYAAAARGVERVVLLGPAHRYPFRGLAAHSADAFASPLGEVAIERCELPHTQVLDAAHDGEHSLEVHLPFLQVVLDDFALIPLTVGDAAPEDVAEVLEILWGGPETLVVISSDLSHYHDYETARGLDNATARAIRELRPEAVGPYEACGCRAIGGLLALAREKGLGIETLDLRSSGDTAGDRDRVVGYGAFAVTTS